MKYLKKKKRNGSVKAIVIASVLLVMLLVLLVWLKVAPDNHETETTNAPEIAVQPTESTDVSDTEVNESEIPSATIDENTFFETGEIETPYLTLYFATSLTDYLTVIHNDGNPYILEFYAVLESKPEQRVFDILIGEGADGNLGTIKSNLGEVPVSMIIYAFEPDESWTEGEINTVLALQEISNDLMEQITALQINNYFQGPKLSTEKPESNISADFEISTPYVTLRYPAKWADNLQIEQTNSEDYRVGFFGKLDGKDPVLLFTLIFGGDFGEQIGVLSYAQGQYIPVNLLLEEIEGIGFSQNEQTDLYEMQEAVNQLIDKLSLE